MISVDTNIIVRLLTGDDRDQFRKAKALFAKEEIVVATTVILESEWDLRYAYGFKPTEIGDAFKALFGLSNVNSPDFDVLEKKRYRNESAYWKRR